MCLMCCYEINSFNCMQRDNLVIFMIIVYYIDGMNWQEYGKGLVDFIVQICFMQFFDKDSICVVQ